MRFSTVIKGGILNDILVICNNICCVRTVRGSNRLGLCDLMVDIDDWNTDLAWYKEAQDDFWIGIFIPNIYDSFNYIELD